jgi:hypothetical protein
VLNYQLFVTSRPDKYSRAVCAVFAQAQAQHIRDLTIDALVHKYLPSYPSADRSTVPGGLPAGEASAVAESLASSTWLPDAACGSRSVAHVWRTADTELWAQLRWADRLDFYHEKAQEIQRTIDEFGIEVDLETFVETEEETSTTRVHDDHRLVVIEESDMEFWNNTGLHVKMSAGDKLLIPQRRLHGSIVRSGQCTYHQPVITNEMMA